MSVWDTASIPSPESWVNRLADFHLQEMELW